MESGIERDKREQEKERTEFLPLVDEKKIFPEKKTVLFRVIKQRVLVISYRRFGANYRSHPQGSTIRSFGYLNPENGTAMLFRNVGKELPPLAA
jgi:hypothetical protein